MIEFKNISKSFETQSHTVHAVKDVSFTVNEGEIFGVIGYSGAGKSTLIRTINFLERPTAGTVTIKGQDLAQLSAKNLRKVRSKIGMIFQNFNLMGSQTVSQNIAFPLQYQGIKKQEVAQRVDELLELVDLKDKKHVYPSQLSGGQKQRVAIARALANNPDILLCDEATSALDPQTTQNILELLQKVQKQTGITIVLITHEMQVIKSICDRVAVMEDGEVKEIGDVVEIFSNPQATITKEFVNSTSNYDKIQSLIQDHPESLGIDETSTLIRLDFKGSQTKEAIISSLSFKFEVSASIIYANVDSIQQEIVGSMVVSLEGQRRFEAIEYLEQSQIKVEVYQNGRTLS